MHAFVRCDRQLDKMSAQDLRRVYYHIIDDVVAKMKAEFVQEGVDEAVLHTVRQNWTQKLIERGIIAEVEAQDDHVKTEDGAGASLSRKRAHDGSGPHSRQHALPASAPGPAVSAAAVTGPGSAMPVATGVHLHQQPQRAVMPLGAMPAMAHPGLVGRPAGIPNMPHVGLQAAMPGAAMQSHPRPATDTHPAMSGNPQAAPVVSLQALQALQALQQAQQTGQPLPPNVQIQQMQALQHLIRQQQQQQQLLQQQQQVIPQRDGSADVPSPLEAAAAAGGMDVRHLRSVLPARFAKALAAASGRCRAQQLKTSAEQPGLDTSVGRSRSKPVVLAPTAAAAPPGEGSMQQSGGLACNQQQCHPINKRRRIPQLDGNGDDDDEEDEEGEGGAEEEEDGEDEDDGDEGAEDAADGDQDDEDDADIADLDNDLDAQEEADREDIDNVGFALYEKVQRSKNRWKCSLRYGVFFINGKEYMFNKASTDLTF